MHIIVDYMIARDAREKEIYLGTKVRYLGTHTEGAVEDIIIKAGIAWVKVSSTGLYYRSDLLELLVHGSSKQTRNKKYEYGTKKTNKMNKMHFKEISHHPDGPGYGGG